MPTLPDIEPVSFTAGETVQWTRSFSDYSALSWTLKYALQASGKPLLTLTATADGSGFTVTVPAATTASYAPAAYLWTAYVEAGSTRHTVARGTVSILPSPLAALGTTHASRMLALIQAALEGRIPNGLESTNIDGQELTRIPVVDLERLEMKYRARVLNEEAAARAAAGLRSRRHTIGIRFVNPR